jgi:hypothetical protein
MLKKIQSLFAVLLAVLVFAACSQAIQPAGETADSAARALRVGLPPTQWSSFTPLPFTNTYADQVNALATDSTFLLAVGFDSEDRIAYTHRYSPSTGWMNLVNLSSAVGFIAKPSSAHYLNGSYLVTAGTGSVGAFSADGGANWRGTTIGFGTKAGLYGSSDGNYVVAGQDGQAAYTGNLLSPFTTITNYYTGWSGTGPNAYINTGAYGDGVYVFGGGSGRIAYTDTILYQGTSTPKRWTTATVPTGTGTFETDGFVNVIVYGGGVFVAVGNNAAGTGVVMYSTNSGQTWNAAIISSTSLATAPVYALAYGNGYFTAINDNGDAAYSTNGIIWSRSTATGPTVFGTNPYVNYAVYYPTTNTFFVGGENNAGMVLAVSN